MLIMSSTTERNKQSFNLPPFFNGGSKCDNMMMTVSKNDAESNAPSSSSSDAAGPQMCVTLGPVPSSSSWCSPLQLGSPRGHWSGGITESLWPRELWFGSQDSDVKTQVSSAENQLLCIWNYFRYQYQRGKHRQRRPQQRASRLGGRFVERPFVRFGDSANVEQRLQRGLCVSLGIRWGRSRMFSRHCLPGQTLVSAAAAAARQQQRP